MSLTDFRSLSECANQTHSMTTFVCLMLSPFRWVHALHVVPDQYFELTCVV